MNLRGGPLRSLGLRGAAGLLLAATAGSTLSCGERPPTYALVPGERISFSVTVREELETVGSRTVEVHLEGTAAGEGKCDLRVRSLRWERWRPSHHGVDRKRTRSVVDTESPVTDPSELSEEDISVARILRASVGSPVSVRVDPREGLASIAGVAVLARPAGMEPRDEGTSSDLAPLLSDDALLRALSAAGLCAIPVEVTRRSGPVEREATVLLPGLGELPVRLTGEAGREHEGSPVAKLKGRVRASDVAKLKAPPPEVGPVLADEVEIGAETLYDSDTLRPLRGNAEVVVPFARGAVLRRRTSFRWVVTSP